MVMQSKLKLQQYTGFRIFFEVQNAFLGVKKHCYMTVFIIQKFKV